MLSPVKKENFLNEKCFKAHAELSKKVGAFVSFAKVAPQRHVPREQLKVVRHVLEGVVALENKVGEVQGENPTLARAREASDEP